MSKALIVDDEADMRWLLTRLLQDQGFEVFTAEGGEAALAQIAHGPPDVVLLDLKMPGLDGIQVLEQAKAVDPEMPVVMITAHGDLPSAVQAMRFGAYDYLTKPFENDQMLFTVRRALERREVQAGRLKAARLSMLQEVSRTLSHEINNALTPILGHAQMLERETPDPEVGRRAKVIIEGCKRIAAVIRQVASIVDPGPTCHPVIGRMLDLANSGTTGNGPREHGEDPGGG